MRMGYIKYIVMMPLLLPLGACTSEWDMQGVDPKDFYSEHPIKNTLDERSASVELHFAGGGSSLGSREIDKLETALHGISPLSVQSIQIQFSSAERSTDARQDYLTKWMRHNGFMPETLQFDSSDAVRKGNVLITVSYLEVVSPDCPDWKTSPITTYSNTMQGNFTCATEVNMGLMIADPHDLVRGTGDVTLDSERDSKAMQDYRSGRDFSASGSGGGAAGANAASGGAAGASQPAPPPVAPGGGPGQ